VNVNIQNFTSLAVCAQNFKALSIFKIGKDVKVKTPLEFAEACSLSLEDVNEIEKTLSSLLKLFQMLLLLSKSRIFYLACKGLLSLKKN
jgi:hypothetical protein